MEQKRGYDVGRHCRATRSTVDRGSLHTTNGKVNDPVTRESISELIRAVMHESGTMHP